MRSDGMRILLPALCLAGLWAACDGGEEADWFLGPAGEHRSAADVVSGGLRPDAEPGADGPRPDAPRGGGEPPPAATVCHPLIAAAIDRCMDDWLADPDFDPTTTSRLDLLAQCADAEPVAPARDELCAAEEAPAALCDVDYETFAAVQLPVCFHEASQRLADRSCVFGERFRDLYGAAEAIVLVEERVLTAGTALTPLESEQVVRTVAATTAFGDVVTTADVFAAVDRHEVNQLELWDASGRRPYTAYEVGAGDNSFGIVFRQGTTAPVALIRDGDVVECLVTWGPERRRCLDDADCAPGLRCVGRPAELPLGRCVALDAPEHPARGQACHDGTPCPEGAGLVCAGARDATPGACEPAWMRGRYEVRPAQPVPDASLEGATAPLLVWGLAEEAADVTLDLLVTHPRAADLRVTLTTPGGSELVLVDGDAPGPELALRDETLRALPAGEPANGVWWLRVTDLRTGAGGTWERFGLSVTSRPRPAPR